MTVKCLPHQDKYEIAMLYVGKQMSSEELATAYNVSKRTINRVLVEMEVNRVRHYQPKAKAQVSIPDAAPEPKPIELPITMIEQPFWVRLTQFAKRALAFPFK